MFPILMIHLTSSIKHTYEEKSYAIKKEKTCVMEDTQATGRQIFKTEVSFNSSLTHRILFFPFPR